MEVTTHSPADLTEQANIANTRPGTSIDEVLGVACPIVASVSDAAEVSRVLAWANSRGLKVVPCGTRTKLDRGSPPARCDILLDLSGMAEVVEHAAGDLTVTVQPGVTLAALQKTLAGARQFLAVDPPVPGTIGGLIATGDSGPRRLRYGGVRDLILGVTFVRPDGVIAKGGGKVVKNVAGYDLPKLLTGALGTLGVVVEATFRLYSLPEASATTVAEGISFLDAGRAAQALLHSTLVPTSMDFFASGIDEASTLAVRFEGSAMSVQVQGESAARTIGEQTSKSAGQPSILKAQEEAALWDSMIGITHTENPDVLARLTSTMSGLPKLLSKAQLEAHQTGAELSVRAHMGHGQALLRWRAAPTEIALSLLTSLRRNAEAEGSSLVIWRAPDEVRTQLDIWGNIGEGLELMRNIKAQFDPKSTLNPGRFVGGI